MATTVRRENCGSLRTTGFPTYALPIASVVVGSAHAVISDYFANRILLR
jgi:hypothetical protein